MSTHFEELSLHIPNLSSKKVLDLGCGRGKFLLQAAKAGCLVSGIDIYDVYLKEARERVSGFPNVENIVQSTGEELPFEDESFDFINLGEVVEHVEDPLKVLSEVCRVLKPEGFSYISIPSRFGIRDPHYHMWFINWLPRFFLQRL